MLVQISACSECGRIMECALTRWDAEKRRDNRFGAMLFDRYGGRKAIRHAIKTGRLVQIRQEYIIGGASPLPQPLPPLPLSPSLITTHSLIHVVIVVYQWQHHISPMSPHLTLPNKPERKRDASPLTHTTPPPTLATPHPTQAREGRGGGGRKARRKRKEEEGRG